MLASYLSYYYLFALRGSRGFGPLSESWFMSPVLGVRGVTMGSCVQLIHSELFVFCSEASWPSVTSPHTFLKDSPIRSGPRGVTCPPPGNPGCCGDIIRHAEGGPRDRPRRSPGGEMEKAEKSSEGNLHLVWDGQQYVTKTQQSGISENNTLLLFLYSSVYTQLQLPSDIILNFRFSVLNNSYITNI